MKFLNKFFVFFSILIILSFAIAPLSMATDYSVGCNIYGSSADHVDNQVQAYIYEFYRGTHSTFKGPVQYNVKESNFRCSPYYINHGGDSNSEYKLMMLNYFYLDGAGNKVLAHTTAYTNFQFGADDIGIDIDGGRLVISNLLYSDEDAWNQIYSSVSGVITGISGIGILCCILAFIIQIIKLGASAGNPAEREKAIKGILWTGIGTAGCGAAALLFGLAYNLLW